MKKAIASLSIGMLLFHACTKSDSRIAADFKEMAIVKTVTPGSAVKSNDIVSVVTCQGPDLCYRFSHFAVTEAGNKTFDIRAKANYPGAPAVCAQAIYRVDTTFRITVSDVGTYYLRFYNGNELFKTDTVGVE
jgi:hypothetical protein